MNHMAGKAADEGIFSASDVQESRFRDMIFEYLGIMRSQDRE